MGVILSNGGARGAWRAGLISTASLAALTAAAMLAPVPVMAQQADPAAAVAQRQTDFNIPAQDLNGALISFARAAGVQVFYEADTVKGRQSTALSGSFTAEDGLTRLLAGSGLTYHFTGSNTVALDPLPATGGAMNLAPVTVQGTVPAPAQAEIGNLPPVYAGGQVARGAKLGLLGNRDVMDTPFNTTSYTSELIRNQQARTVADVLENDSSVRFSTPGGHAMENFRIRGFGVEQNELALNGMYGMLPFGHVPTEFLERVEVLKGPSALLSGMAPSGGVGGTVNLVPKRAGDAPLTRVTVDYTSEGQYGAHADVGRRFGTDDRVGVRLNAAYRDGDTVLDGQEKERLLGAVGLDYRGEKLRLALDAYGTKETNDGGSPMAVGFDASVKSVLPAPDGGTNLFQGLKGEEKSLGAVLRAEYDIADDVTAFAAVGGRTSDYSGLVTSTQAITTLATGVTDLKMVNQHGVVNAASAEAGVRGRFETGPVKHEVVFTASTLSVEEDKRYNLTWVNDVYNIYSSSSPYFPPSPADPIRSADSTLNSMALADTLSFLDDRVQLMLGGRRQVVKTTGYQDNTGVETSNYNESKVSPALGVVLKPFDAPVSLYGNYIEGLTPGSRVNDALASNNGKVFEPYKTTQREVGVKWDAGRITNTLSLFQITKPSLSQNAGLHVYTQSDQVNRGVEWNVFGEVTDSIRVLGGLTYMKSELKKTINGQYDGNEAWGTPKWQSNIGLEWDTPFVDGLTLDGRAVYTGSQYVNSANTLKIDDWWRFDVGARYAVKVREQDVTLRANVYNLFDKDYWVGSFSDGYVTLSTPRTFMLSASVDF